MFKVKPNKTRDYPLFFLHDKEGKLHKSSPAVCIYGSTWHRVGRDRETGEPVLKEPRPEIHEYDESSEEDSDESDDDQPQDDPINQQIRNQPISPLLTAPPMSTTATLITALTTQTTAPSAAPPTSQTTTPVVATPASISAKLSNAL